MRYILILFFLSSYLFALITEPVHSRIRSINTEDKTVQIEAIGGAQVGMFGVIVKHFTPEHATALSWVRVLEVHDEVILASIIPIKALEQSALPAGVWEPSIGDEVVLGYNYQRALLIAPNPSIYKRITKHHTEKKWVHPDIFAAVLSTRGHPTPLIEDFQSMCRANNIGILSFAIDNSLIFLDCHSFTILQTKSTNLKTDEIQLPFYTRVTKIEANWFGDGSDPLEEYGFYYINLIADYNPDNAFILDYQNTHFKKNILGQWVKNEELNTTQN